MRLALELVFEGLQAAGLPSGRAGVTFGGSNTPQQSLRIGDAVTVTLASEPRLAPPPAKQPVAQAAKADGSKAALGGKLLAKLLSAAGERLGPIV